MSGVIMSFLRQGAELLIGRGLIKQSIDRVVTAIILYAVVLVLGLAALVFAYVFLYRLVAESRGDEAAAAILCGGNLLLIVLILIGKTLTGRRAMRTRATSFPLASAESFDAGIALGRGLGKRLRKAAPEITLAAAVIGIIVGVRPQLLGIFRRDREPAERVTKRRQ